MDTKILIGGSAIAVVVLVLASFSPVVGYNSIESSAKESPLFNVRTNRAISEESEILTCNYLRKGQLIPFPTRNSKTAQIQKMIDIIKRMDDKTFNKFIEQVAHRYRTEQNELEVSLEGIIAVLYQMKYGTEKLYELEKNEYTPDKFTYDTPQILCLILTLIYFLIYDVILYIIVVMLTFLNECETYYCGYVDISK